jgi:hypothetical protein
VAVFIDLQPLLLSENGPGTAARKAVSDKFVEASTNNVATSTKFNAMSG